MIWFPGRNWGPMSWLVYLGLDRYTHLDSVKAAKKVLSAQSEATFLVRACTRWHARLFVCDRARARV